MIEDKKEHQGAIASAFRRLAFNIDFTVDGSSGLEQLKKFEWDYKVVLIDLDLPGRDGIEVAKDVKYWREERGFNVAPEIICITANRKYMTADIMMEIERKLGMKYLLKFGFEHATLALEAAAKWVDFQRINGPYILFRKRNPGATTPGGTPERKRLSVEHGRSRGEGPDMQYIELTDISINQKHITLPRIESKLFYYIAWYSGRHAALSYDDLMYEFCVFEDRDFSREHIKQCLSRIRNALQKAGCKPEDVLAETRGGKIRLHAWVDVEPDTAELVSSQGP